MKIEQHSCIDVALRMTKILDCAKCIREIGKYILSSELIMLNFMCNVPYLKLLSFQIIRMNSKSTASKKVTEN